MQFGVHWCAVWCALVLTGVYVGVYIGVYLVPTWYLRPHGRRRNHGNPLTAISKPTANPTIIIDVSYLT